MGTQGLPNTALVPIPHGRASGGANAGPCWYCCSRIGRGRLGRGPGQEDVIPSDFKGLFCFWKGSGFHSAPPPRSHARCPWDLSTTCCNGIISPQKSIWARGGEGRGGTGWEGMSSSLPKGCHSFQMSFPEA